MNYAEGNGENLCAIYVDMGTTNTRVWLHDGRQVLARASDSVGVRDAARSGSRSLLHSALGELVARVREEAGGTTPAPKPLCVVAAGMGSSAFGLAEVPHVPAPAGLRELEASSRWFEFPEITDLPMLLIPGVRCGRTDGSVGELHDMDVMRGEETLCIGLTELGLARPPTVVLNLGSHWKAIQLDGEGRIATSVTSLSGELIHAAQTQTILASAVSRDRPGDVAREWMEAGMREERRSGLARALFCIRLLELAGKGTEDERLAFLIGAFIASDLDALVARKVLAPENRVVITGSGALADAWCWALMGVSIEASALGSDVVEKGLLAGMRAVLLRSHSRREVTNAAKPFQTEEARR